MEEVRVLSFGAALAGNVCAMMLAELGADVIKIESPQAPDTQRLLYFPDHPPTVEPGGTSTSALFGGIARSVRGIALDMGADLDRQHFARLVTDADVVLENFRPGVLDRWGFGFEALQKLNPRIIVVSMSGFGATTPRDGFVCYGTTSSAFTGLADRTTALTASHQDEMASMHGAVGIMAALAYRDATGRPVWIDQAQSDSGAAAMGPAFLSAILNAGDDVRDAAFAPGSLFYGVFECAEDGTWMALEIESGEQWDALRHLLAPDGVELSDIGDVDIEEAKRLIAGWFRGQRSFRALKRLTSHLIPAGLVQRPGDIYRDPQLRQRGFIEEVTHPDLGTVEYPRPPYRLSRTPARIVRPAPRLGQHNDETLGGVVAVAGK